MFLNLYNNVRKMITIRCVDSFRNSNKNKYNTTRPSNTQINLINCFDRNGHFAPIVQF
jgi:hypothetical protein